MEAMGERHEVREQSLRRPWGGRTLREQLGTREGGPRVSWRGVEMRGEA